MLYTHMHIHLNAERNDDTIITTSDTVLWKIYLSLYLKNYVWERELETKQNCNILTLTLLAVPFPFSWSAQPVAWGLTLLGAGFLYRIMLPTGLVSKLTDFLSSPSYIIVGRPPSSGRHNFALIQPIHGQGYNILIFLDRMNLLFT